jgi:hypothetical protein
MKRIAFDRFEDLRCVRRRSRGDIGDARPPRSVEGPERLLDLDSASDGPPQHHEGECERGERVSNEGMTQ